AIAASGNESCALTSSGGGLKCWGANNDGQVGDGTTKRRLTPAAVSGLSTGVETMAVGGFNDAHTCALLTGGAMKCWGENTQGQLGDGTTDNRWRPTPVSGLSSGVVAIAAADAHSCAVIAGGAAKCWGFSHLGELGDGTGHDSY